MLFSLRLDQVIKSPRVFHIGECGLHHKGKNCTTEARVNQISKILKDNKDSLFPKRFSCICFGTRTARDLFLFPPFFRSFSHFVTFHLSHFASFPFRFLFLNPSPFNPSYLLPSLQFQPHHSSSSSPSSYILPSIFISDLSSFQTRRSQSSDRAEAEATKA